MEEEYGFRTFISRSHELRTAIQAIQERIQNVLCSMVLYTLGAQILNPYYGPYSTVSTEWRRDPFYIQRGAASS